MPYKSDAQRRFFHTDTAKKKGITPEQVAEFDEASKGMKLPEKAEMHSGEKAEKKMHPADKKRKRAVIDNAIRGNK